MSFLQTLGKRLGLFVAIIGVWFLTGTASVKGNAVSSMTQNPLVGGILVIAGVGMFAGISIVSK